MGGGKNKQKSSTGQAGGNEPNSGSGNTNPQPGASGAANNSSKPVDAATKQGNKILFCCRISLEVLGVVALVFGLMVNIF